MIETNILTFRQVTLKDATDTESYFFSDKRVREIYKITISQHFYENIIRKGYLAFDADELLNIKDAVTRSIYTMITKWRNNKLYLIKPAYFIAKGFKPEDIQLWTDVGFQLNEISDFLEIGVDNHQEAKLWKDNMSIYEIKEWVKLGIKDSELAQNWKSVVGDIGNASFLIRDGITNTEEVKILKDKGFEIDEIALIIKNNLSLNAIKEWRENDIKDIKKIAILVNGGFDNPKKYLPYKNIDKDHAIKLYKWGIKPNKLIESMSRSDRVLFKKELFFKNQERFVSFYDKLNNANCSEIINNYFTNIDMSKNKNQCLMFIGNMIQRLDEKSFFGKITQKGLVNDMTKKNFYVESFDGDWLENEYKIGVIKGNEFFNYESKIGKQVIPKGTVIILDALDTLDKW
mgnify:CR=1 FL=1